MQTLEEIIKQIAESGKDRVTTVEIHASVNVNHNGVSKIAYYCRAWRSEGPSNMPCSASAYDLEELRYLMLRALSKYPTPDTDKQREIAELETKLALLKK